VIEQSAKSLKEASAGRWGDGGSPTTRQRCPCVGGCSLKVQVWLAHSGTRRGTTRQLRFFL